MDSFKSSAERAHMRLGLFHEARGDAVRLGAGFSADGAMEADLGQPMIQKSGHRVEGGFRT
jgi:hypothetical protein